MLSKTLNGRGKLFSGFLGPMKLITGSNHGKSDQLLLITNISGLKSGGMKVSIWRDLVVLKLFFLKITKLLFESLKVEGHPPLDILTRRKD